MDDPPEGAPPLSEARRTSPTLDGSKVERLTQQTRGLFEDVKAWVELRIKLIRLELEEELNARKREAGLLAGMAVLGLAALLFMLIALALGIGAWLGSSSLGFLIVALLLLLGVGLLQAVRAAGAREKAKETEASRSAPKLREKTSEDNLLPPSTS